MRLLVVLSLTTAVFLAFVVSLIYGAIMVGRGNRGVGEKGYRMRIGM